jgi:hypothetical protein
MRRALPPVPGAELGVSELLRRPAAEAWRGNLAEVTAGNLLEESAAWSPPEAWRGNLAEVTAGNLLEESAAWSPPEAPSWLSARVEEEEHCRLLENIRV